MVLILYLHLYSTPSISPKSNYSFGCWSSPLPTPFNNGKITYVCTTLQSLQWKTCQLASCWLLFCFVWRRQRGSSIWWPGWFWLRRRRRTATRWSIRRRSNEKRIGKRKKICYNYINYQKKKLMHFGESYLNQVIEQYERMRMQFEQKRQL